MSHAEQYRALSGLQLLDSAAAATSKLAKAEAKLQVQELARQIAELQNLFAAQHGPKLLIVLQGMDTSGKDGTVKGVFGEIHPLGARTVAFKAPSASEKDHDFLWRIHQNVPAKGEIVIFNRSHYEDVLISKVHGWIDEAECQRRYAHIREFERMLSETGTIVLKFFLHISKAEQKLRIEERLRDPDKQWKFDPQDIAERAHWDAYQQAYTQAIVNTDSITAPWYVIPADSKTQRNLAIASIVLDKLESLQLSYPALNPAYTSIQVV
ncbi:MULTISPECIES: PPK2 family polyphosphate kinase [unclassified Undibacterium]|uniref:PPK2 family polyphosphate kinase n=1 Tax=unclassified Undibacterium TaxID=2630295 RepID=UPI002AC97BD9|nr:MULTISPECIES: PPK2 family polyphosphate kinase [unclassified Undibacterium]MEB0137860.1 polyphosphate kinase 2 family protein [Undibacterium sp. CCC2.1]MEB0170949.1 polyphosphate kinase 2 family protein [Undibacterium sp. CCC1.1]MEB0174994.1 polyphosphate kinase 2 family protein [Undibacterium sp. CCC3.4]MEB0215800.1 polyphosphate kinase 2 family protein [Undibacterium sp. 5I2]WPX44800.1 polyphosphate kinase 2 family protein [Undibacterium sp. CCC3.4]